MSEEVYVRLAERLDQIPNGFAIAPSGSHLRLLQKLFTPEEALVASVMRLVPESAEEIAPRAGMDPKAAYRVLKGMARHGLIHAGRGERGLAFQLMPFAVGIYEFQIGRMDAEMAELFETWYQETHGGALSGKNPPITRVIPVGETVSLELEVHAHEAAAEIVENAQAWGVLPCLCRTQQKLLGKGCDHTMNNCMVFSSVPGVFDHSDVARAITKQEALQILREAEQEGLVHTTSNFRGGALGGDHKFICNCCTCCCGVLRAVQEFAIPTAVAHAAVVSEVDPDLCIACGECAERCPFGAISLEDDAWTLDRKRCVGCGQCVLACTSDALHMTARPADETAPLPNSEREWMEARAAVRGISLDELM